MRPFLSETGSVRIAVALCVAIGLFLVRSVLGWAVGAGSVAVVIWLVFCSGGLIWVNWSTIINFTFEIMGRSASLTGRAGLWEGCWDAVQTKSILGYGYSAFWGGEQLLIVVS
jgi:exopolysaccharide production protein ExoQ